MHFVLGVAALEQSEPVLAVRHLGWAAEAEGNHAAGWIQLARARAMLQDFPGAVSDLERALALSPDDAQVIDSAGVILTTCGLHVRAAGAFKAAADLAPANAGIHYNLATSLTMNGEIAAAKNHLETCISLDPMHWRAHYALSHLERQTPRNNHVQRLERLLEQLAGRVTASLGVGVALAKELEDLGDYSGAFRQLTLAKRAPRRLLGHDPSKDRSLFDALAGLQLPTSAQPVGFQSEEPIFVVGMPRTGTTLVDRILSTHPLVTSAGELHSFAAAFKHAAGGAAFNLFSPASIRATHDLDWRAMGQRYIESTRPLTGASARFTDKLPHNFLYAGLIAASLPRARIVCVLRNPMDTCLSNFRQLFAPESPYFDYSYDLLHVGEYYLGFRRLMDHWRKLFPQQILEVEYEAVVMDQESTSRRLLEFCGLPWDPACLRFELNEAPVATASAAQVREPIYRSAVGRWKNYRSELLALERLLSAAGIEIDESSK
jgi:tetratricopeptide (TPR) repeat protein